MPKRKKIVVDTHELKDAQWFSKEKIQSLVAAKGEPMAGKVTPNNWTMVKNALEGSLITYELLPNSVTGRATYLYKGP